jgi:hypothetical protein
MMSKEESPVANPGRPRTTEPGTEPRRYFESLPLRELLRAAADRVDCMLANECADDCESHRLAVALRARADRFDEEERRIGPPSQTDTQQQFFERQELWRLDDGVVIFDSEPSLASRGEVIDPRSVRRVIGDARLERVAREAFPNASFEALKEK